MWILIGAVVIGAAALGPIASNVEEASYKVVESQGSIEIRDYAPMIVAQAQARGDREEAIDKGFRTIADYIFGNNISQAKVAMTAPVTREALTFLGMSGPSA